MQQEAKKIAYQKTSAILIRMLKKEKDMVLKMATINCLLRETLPYYFWTGFYVVKNGALHVGPYQGTLGCLHIAFGKGVCGAAAKQKKTQVVPDVHKFPGHIACDSRSASEIVVPVFSHKKLIAVFDVDSVKKNSFDDIDQKYLEKLFKNVF